MSSTLVSIITVRRPRRARPVAGHFRPAASAETLLAECDALEAFRHESGNLYERVRACFFLYALHRFHLPAKPGYPRRRAHSLRRLRSIYWSAASKRPSPRSGRRKRQDGPSDALSSALAAAYHRHRLPDTGRPGAPLGPLGARQPVDVPRRPPGDQPLRVRPELLRPRIGGRAFPILQERTPVRMDLTHSAWSDIFFLGMDYPEGARVLNVSVDLGVHGRDAAPKPPVEAYFRVIDEPVLRLTQRGSGRDDRHHRSGRSVRLRPRLFGAAQSRADRVGPGPAGHGRLGAASDGSLGAAGRAGAGHRADQQRQRHPQRLAPGRLHQPAGRR